MSKEKPLVSIIMGSDSDLPVMRSAMDVLDKFGISYEVKVSSAHRTLDRTVEYTRTLDKRGLKIIIAGAGGSAHLPGVAAAATILPVIGVPLASSPLKGLDALMSIVQMPGGVPVGCMGIGESGAANAALLAVRILALEDDKIKKLLIKYIEDMSKKVVEKDKQLQQQITKK
ncbi:MAG: 5-(carboxyamino)imidazole ribonucleotide mutase [bacterium]|nr:5-(carboxyamino)imidazole ribonucleotide mutase [bacterium]